MPVMRTCEYHAVLLVVLRSIEHRQNVQATAKGKQMNLRPVVAMSPVHWLVWFS
jgi:hypothetical protein